MSSKTPAAIVGLLITESHEYGYFHIKAHPVSIGPTADELCRPADERRTDVHESTIRNISNNYPRASDFYLESLEVYSQGNEDGHGDRSLYGWDVQYTPHSVDVVKATAIARSLTTIMKRMEKMSAEFGYAPTYGHYLLRVAKAIGASRMVFTLSNNRSSSYNDQRHAITSLTDGVQRVDQLIAAWKEKTTAA